MDNPEENAIEVKTLGNGLRMAYVKRKSNSVAIEITVRAGSNDEGEGYEGISHFIEHMVFDGTKKRPSPSLISNEIEKLGGELNAATSNEKTSFFVKVLKKHFDIGFEVISDIVLNPLFRDESIEKEKGIVIDEINLVNDQPRFYQWILFQKSLFEKHPARNPVYGKIDSVKAFSREKVVEYYSRHYVASNMDVIVVGDIENPFIRIEGVFGGLPGAKKKERRPHQEPEMNAEKEIREKRSTLQSYCVIGFKTPERSHPDSYVLDVIKGHLGRGQSGRMFDVVRTKHGLAYDVGAFHNPNNDYGFFAVYVNTGKGNIAKVRKLILEELEKAKDMSETELNESKTFLEGDFLLLTEDNQRYADVLSSWAGASDTTDAGKYIRRIMGVTRKDVRRVIDKYFTNPTMIVIE